MSAVFPLGVQRVGEDLQARVKVEFRALHQILHDQESSLLEQLRAEQREELEKVQCHLEAAETAVRDLEENIRVLQKAAAVAQTAVLTEVRRGQEHVRRWTRPRRWRLIAGVTWPFKIR